MAFPFLPVIAGGASLLGGLLSGNAQKNQAKDQANLYNKYLGNYQTGQNAYRDYITGLGPQTTTSFGTDNSNTSQTGTQSSLSETSPTLSAEYSPLVGAVNEMLAGRLKAGGALPYGYAESAVRSINDTFAGAEQAARNAAARFGLSGPQATAGLIPLQTARAGQIADFRAAMPLKARELENQDMQLAQSLAAAFGRGQRTASSGTSSSTGMSRGMRTGSQTGPAPILGAEAFLPPGPMQTTQSGSSALGGALGSAGSMMGFLAANKAFGGGGQPQNNAFVVNGRQPVQQQPFDLSGINIPTELKF